MPISIEQLAAELDATPSEIHSCVREIGRHSNSFRTEYVTEELAARIRAQLPGHRERIELRRQSVQARQDRHLTATELAAELDLSPARIRQWKTRGYLQPVGKAGRQHLYRFGDVLEVHRQVERRTRTRSEIDWRNELRLDDHADRGVTTNQAAELTNVSPSTIRMWVKRGHLKPVGRHGRQLLFVVRDVAAAARRNT